MRIPQGLIWLHNSFEAFAVDFDFELGARFRMLRLDHAKTNRGLYAVAIATSPFHRQINDGYVVLCVARPLSDCTLDIGVESHDKLYRNPFLDPLEPHELKADIATP